MTQILFVTDFATELNFWGTQRGACHDPWRELKYRKPGCDREYYFTHSRVNAI